MNDLDELWESYNSSLPTTDNYFNSFEKMDIDKNIPKCSDIYISTKTKIAYLNQPIDLYNLFWKIPILNYYNQDEGIIKKEIKFNSNCQEDLDLINSNLKNENNYYEEHIITNVKNPNGRIQFKDIRKISIGICKKDIYTYRSKKKGMFYNCFVLVTRIKNNDTFKEIHVKVFNTGKMEIPGIQNDDTLIKTINIITNILNDLLDNNDLYFDNSKTENVLINSNFNCNFYIDRQQLYNILKYDYKINCNYDPCSYPGIQCKFYYYSDFDIENQKGIQITSNKNHSTISFMIFRTGSVLIVGKCDETTLYYIYEFIKTVLYKEYSKICTGNYDISEINIVKKPKIKIKKITLISNI